LVACRGGYRWIVEVEGDSSSGWNKKREEEEEKKGKGRRVRG
jgi:hypothetical protein